MRNKRCIVRATQEQLSSVGCDRDITGKTVMYIKDYSTGYAAIKVEPPLWITELIGERAELEGYDIPLSWLEFIDEKCEHVLIYKQYESQAFGTCAVCDEIIF